MTRAPLLKENIAEELVNIHSTIAGRKDFNRREFEVVSSLHDTSAMSGYHIALIRIWGSRTRFFSENINNMAGFNLNQTQYFSKSGPVESYDDFLGWTLDDRSWE